MQNSIDSVFATIDKTKERMAEEHRNSMLEEKAKKRRELQNNSILRKFLGASESDLTPLTPEEEDLLAGKDMEHLIIWDDTVCRINDAGYIVAPEELAKKYAGQKVSAASGNEGKPADNQVAEGKTGHENSSPGKNAASEAKKDSSQNETPGPKEKTATDGGNNGPSQNTAAQANQKPEKRNPLSNKNPSVTTGREKTEQNSPAQKTDVQKPPAADKSRKPEITLTVGEAQHSSSDGKTQSTKVFEKPQKINNEDKNKANSFVKEKAKGEGEQKPKEFAPAVVVTPVVIQTDEVVVLAPVSSTDKSIKMYFSAAYNERLQKGAYAAIIKRLDDSDIVMASSMYTNNKSDPVFIGIVEALEVFDEMGVDSVTIFAEREIGLKLRRNSQYIVDGFSEAAGNYLKYLSTIANRKYIEITPRESRLAVQSAAQTLANALCSEYPGTEVNNTDKKTTKK